MGHAFGDYGIGFGGGLIYALVASMLGSGLIGSLAAPIAAGSFLKGNKGTIIATIAGFRAASDMFSGGLNLGGQNSGPGVM